ncbi:rab-GTPase-TBC domain-domain-containing protein [Kockovaella imperatae]|uniref:Rab-GTPase-TBC domain-domain-containing protein n=1 Tax=Kockovaella imperatae TaxID=4999 RepID=A0A1Y1UC24_9TREE|nr:rab-GTPase-TBC domain-domain-containing protein [Kockovaella imperatae]ORX35590.1 rab-GTPase-TBC domain-domain-containing protein [Kockovaella imperatae]
MSYIDPRELNDLASFAVNGGLGRGVATSDCVAESPDQLMFISGDELVLLRELDEVDLASCEGVVGWVKKGLVAFERTSAAAAGAAVSVSASSPGETTPKSSLEVSLREDLPRTILIAPSPSPPRASRLLPSDQPDHLDPSPPQDLKRVSGPFELESPQQSPNIDHDRFSIQQAAATLAEASQPMETLAQSRPESQIEIEVNRESVFSVASSEMYGGIGGFMMGTGGSEDSHETNDFGVSPVTTSVETPFPAHSDPPSPSVIHADQSKRSSTPDDEDMDDEEWDIYDQYARESMYAPLKRMSLAARRASKKADARESMAAFEGLGAVHAARAALEGGSVPKVTVDTSLDPVTPRQAARNPIPSPLTGRSIATELRLRIQREREAAEKQSEKMGSVPEPPVRTTSVEETQSSPAEESLPSPPQTNDVPPPFSPVDPIGLQTEAPVQSEADTFMPTEESVVLDTPAAPEIVTFTGPSPGDSPAPEPMNIPEPLLASPMLLQSPQLDSKPKLEAPADIVLPDNVLLAPRPPRSASPRLAGPPNHTPTYISKHIHAPWTPDTPASPHSITATRQAVEAAKEGKRARGLTLVGRIDADLRGAKGPVPITFVVGEPDDQIRSPLGLGLPPVNNGRTSPVTPEQRSRSPLFGGAPPPPPMPDDIKDIRLAPSRFPTPKRSFTSPIAPEPEVVAEVDAAAGPRPGFIAARPRSRSFSVAMAKAVGRPKKETPPAIHTDVMPVLPTTNSPSSPGTSKLRLLGTGRKSPKASSPNTPVSGTVSHHSTPGGMEMRPPSGRSSSFSFASKTSKTPRKASRALPSPVSHKDFEDTVNAGGMDFELVQPRKPFPLSPTTVNTLGITTPKSEEMDKATLASASSVGSLSTRVALPETDEWGFIKGKMVTPEIFQSRSAPVDHRAAEARWLAVIGSTVPSGGPSKKVKKYVSEGGVPGSLRGKVWSWFLNALSTGMYDKMVSEGRRTSSDQQIERDIARIWSDHSLFCNSSLPGFVDLQSVLRAHLAASGSTYSTPMCHLAGTMLIHSVAEDAFSLLGGLMENVLREYYSTGINIDAGVFDVVLRGSEKDLAAMFKQVGLKSGEFLETWYKQLFIRCLPWPTALRVIDVVVAEGPRFLLIASLTILTLSRDRLLALPHTKSAILEYLEHLPQDSLLLPENFMKATERVKFKDDDWKRLRVGVEKEL